MPQLAAAVELVEVMNRWHQRRPVFHSEADFQHAFGQVLNGLALDLQIRVEVPQSTGETVDLVCFGDHGQSLVEFKYFTAHWQGTDPQTNETFKLADHAATDLARRNFIFDIVRLERFCAAGEAAPAATGSAMMLTNEPGLWTPPFSRRRRTRDYEFRIHDGQHLTGSLRWGDEQRGYFPPNERTLRGSYALTWHLYSELPGAGSAQPSTSAAAGRWLDASWHAAALRRRVHACEQNQPADATHRTGT